MSDPVGGDVTFRSNKILFQTPLLSDPTLLWGSQLRLSLTRNMKNNIGLVNLPLKIAVRQPSGG